MSTPVGHTLVAAALARRFDVRSRRGLLTAATLANAPDLDIALGMALYQEPWRLHRAASHDVLLVTSAGAIAGALGLIACDGRRSRWRDALAGAAIAGSHVALDALPFVRLSRKPWVPVPLRRRVAGMSIANWILDAGTCGALAALILMAGRRTETL